MDMRKTYRAIIQIIRFLIVMILVLFLVMILFRPEGLVRLFDDYYSSYCFNRDSYLSLKLLFVSLLLMSLSFSVQFLLSLKSRDKTQKLFEHIKAIFSATEKNPYLVDIDKLSHILITFSLFTHMFRCD